jgi:hypothetical protein
MSKKFGMALLLAAGLLATADGANALDVVVTHVDKHADGSATYHFRIATGPGETFSPGTDFVTIYNFKLVDGSAKSPDGWTFSSEEFGKTPTWHGYPVVGPVDMPGLSNLTWTPSEAIPGGTQIEGFSATTRMGSGGNTEGEYTAEITRNDGGKTTRQAVIGHIPTPSYVQ